MHRLHKPSDSIPVTLLPTPCFLLSIAKDFRTSSDCLHLAVLIAYRKKYGFPRLSLSTYLQFWCVVCYLITAWLLLFKKEVNISLSNVHTPEQVLQEVSQHDDPEIKLSTVYKSMWKMCKLKRVSGVFFFSI